VRSRSPPLKVEGKGALLGMEEGEEAPLGMVDGCTTEKRCRCHRRRYSFKQ
jgi:hypothetical protein